MMNEKVIDGIKIFSAELKSEPNQKKELRLF